MRQEHDWVKVHLMCGVKTNVVTAVEIYDRNANECPILPALLATTAKTFTIREASADNQYASKGNFEAIGKYGATPFVTSRPNITEAAGGLFAKASNFFSFHQAEFFQTCAASSRPSMNSASRRCSGRGRRTGRRSTDGGGRACTRALEE